MRGEAMVSVNQSRHRDLLKTKTKAIEPVLDADGSDRKVAKNGAGDPICNGVP
jgi:hypothetical protein